MASILKIKRRAAGGAAGPPSSLATGELAYNEQDDKLYYGKGGTGTAASIVAIGGTAAGGGVPEPGADGFYGRQLLSGVGSWVAAVKKAGDVMTGALTVAFANPAIYLQKTTTAEGCYIIGTNVGVPRWQMLLGNAAAESGSNAGSNFQLMRCDDAGASLGYPIQIARSNGTITLTGVVNTIPPAAGVGLSVGASTLNGFQIQPQAAGSAQCLLNASGVDTNIVLAYSSKGVAAQNFYTSSFSNLQVQIAHQTAAGFLTLAGGDGSSTAYNIWKSDTSNVRVQTPAQTSNDTSIATTAFCKALAVSCYGVRGLSGATSATQFIVTFTEAVLHTATGSAVLARNGSLTVTQTAAVGANGPDATLANGDVHLYAIWNGTTLAGICSNTGPTTGPTLPSGYTHWAYLTSVKRTSGNLLVVLIRGNKCTYGTTMTTQQILSGANPGNNIWASVSTASFVPAIANSVFLAGNVSCVNTAAGAIWWYLGPTNGIANFEFPLSGAFAGENPVQAIQAELPNMSQLVWYAYTVLSGSFSSNDMDLYVRGYEVPNNS